MGSVRMGSSAVFAWAAVLLCFLPALHAAVKSNCVYTLYVRTGSIWRGGTDSTIAVEFFAGNGVGIGINNLTAWGGGFQGAGYKHFERGSLDIFSGLGDCVEEPICYMKLVSNGEDGWYANYVEVTFTGAHLPCSQHLFEVNRWLASDTYPWSLEFEADECDSGFRRGPSLLAE